MCVCVCMYVCMCVYLCMYVCMYVLERASFQCANYCIVGVIRAIDRQERVFFLLTPVAPEALESVNLLAKAGVDMPRCLFAQQVRV